MKVTSSTKRTRSICLNPFSDWPFEAFQRINLFSLWRNNVPSFCRYFCYLDKPNQRMVFWSLCDAVGHKDSQSHIKEIIDDHCVKFILTLNISVARSWIFLLWIETDPSLVKRSSWNDSLSLWMNESIFHVDAWFWCYDSDCVTSILWSTFKLPIEKWILMSFLFSTIMYRVIRARVLNLPLAFLQSEFTWSSKFRYWSILTPRSLLHIVFFMEDSTTQISALFFLLRGIYQCFPSYDCRRTTEKVS